MLSPKVPDVLRKIAQTSQAVRRRHRKRKGEARR
jgi:hypothetical protein